MCTFCAPHSRKARNVSGSVQPRDEIADKFRLCEHSTHDNCGTPSPALCTSCALHGTCQALSSLPTCSGSVHFVCSPLTTHDNCGESQALRTLPTVSGSVSVHSTHEQAFCTPMMKLPTASGSFVQTIHLLCIPFMQNVSGFCAAL